MILYRQMNSEDQPMIWQMLYHAIYVPPESEPPPQTIVALPELRQYAEDFGKHQGDIGIAAFDAEKVVGMCWVRLIHGYGYIDDTTPEITIAVLPAYRGKGIGTRMLAQLLLDISPHHPQISLSVQRSNPAYRLYQRVGFTDYSVTDESVTMVWRPRSQ